MATASQQFQDALGQLFEDNTFSDFVVECGPKTWHLHRSTLKIHSPYFKALCTGNFEEAKNQKVVIKDKAPEVVECVLKIMYHGPSDLRILVDMLLNLHPARNPFITWIEVHKCANYFQIGWMGKGIIDDLQAYAEAALSPQDYSWKHILPSLTAPEGPCEGRTVQSFVEGVKHAINVYGADTKTDLLESLAGICAIHLPYLMVSRCWNDLQKDVEAHLFTTRVISLYFWGSTTPLLSKQLQIMHACWGCSCQLAVQQAPDFRVGQDSKIVQRYCSFCLPIIQQWLAAPAPAEIATDEVSDDMSNLSMDDGH
ncbi:hypothetical protein BT63DRAFT_465780 [Microthyrium microscopicum]|uniref:BTB domain-containing protein n=1 Tax=Microthyrium microscopicum TaxID=703497 RepID=A0A6A6TU45_9PEZI|nr:hypothetical protein BT63DRAFT_465780 [Microthyrium microscopicum]